MMTKRLITNAVVMATALFLAGCSNDQIENLIARQVDSILCFPKASAVIVKSIKNCKAADVPIIMISEIPHQNEPSNSNLVIQCISP